LSTNNRKKSSSRFSLEPFISDCLTIQKTFGLSGRSLKELSIHLKRLQLFCKNAGLRDITGLTPALLLAFLDIHAYRGKAQLKSIVWSLRTFGGYLALRQYLPDSPAKDLSHPVLRKREKLPLYLRPNELTALLDVAVNKLDQNEGVVIMILCCCGLRPKEIVLLRPQDVNPLRRVLAVTVKGNWRRLVPISTVMAEVLQEYIQECGISTDTPFLVNQWKRPIDVRWIERVVRRAATRAGLRRPVTPRTLRHTFATCMADRHGKTITRAFLGHSSSAATDTYMHLVPGKYRRYMNMHPFQTSPQGVDHD